VLVRALSLTRLSGTHADEGSWPQLQVRFEGGDGLLASHRLLCLRSAFVSWGAKNQPQHVFPGVVERLAQAQWAPPSA
jgi:hypothetical protein